MRKSVGITYAISGTIVAASVIAVTAATIGLGGQTPRQAVEVGGSVTVTVATSTPAPAFRIQPGEQVIHAEAVQATAASAAAIDSGPLGYSRSLAPAVRVADRAHDDDEHEEREHRSTRLGREGR